MNRMYKPNISSTEKLVSTVAGTALALAGYKRSNRMLRLAGLGLIARGVSGFCPVSHAMGRNTASSDTRQALGGSRGVRVLASTTIYRPAQEIYSYWREFEHLPKFMTHLEEVRELDGTRSKWTATGPLGLPVSWEAEIINDIPSELISWRSVGDADVVSAGSVRFKPAAGDHGTEVRVKLQYDPPAGRAGATVAWLLGEDPQTHIEQDLRRFKQLLETGEISTGERYRAPSTDRMGRDQEAMQRLTDPLTSR